MVALTGTFTRLDGDPATGTVKITPSRSPIMDSAGRVVISGPQVFPLDADGKLAVEIPASNDPDLGPPFTYAIDVNLTHASWKISKVWIPHGSTTVDLSEIGDYTPVPGVATRVVTIPADGTDGQVLVWDGAGFTWDFPPEGPQGPPGEVTTAALTTALAGKVTGTGLTLRHDTTVGERILLDHPGGTIMLKGDTGWRNISSLLTWGTGTVWLKRENGIVSMIWQSVRKGEGSPAAFLTIPTGFRPAIWISNAPISDRDNLTARNELDIAGNGIVTPAGMSDLSDGRLQANLSWSTTQPWPTTLPGTP